MKKAGSKQGARKEQGARSRARSKRAEQESGATDMPVSADPWTPPAHYTPRQIADCLKTRGVTVHIKVVEALEMLSLGDVRRHIDLVKAQAAAAGRELGALRLLEKFLIERDGEPNDLPAGDFPIVPGPLPVEITDEQFED
jgi:hypothetical protein